MKSIFYCILFLGACISIAQAQDKKFAVKALPKNNFFLTDTLFKINPYLDSMMTQSIPVAIPNALARKPVYDRQYMPVLKLSGENMAPMPGTENMPKNTVQDSVSLRFLKK